MNVQIEYDPIAFARKTLNMVENVNERIVICALYIENDLFGNKLLNLLSQTIEKKPHVLISLFLDGVYNTKWIAKKYANLKDNVHIINLNNFLPLRVFHIKGWVVDNTFIHSGVNVNNRYFPENNSFRLDRYYFFDSQLLSDLHVKAIEEIKHQAKLKEWLPISVNNYYLSCQNCIISPFYVFNKEGLQSSLIFELCQSAKEEIFLSTPYFNITEEFKIVLKKAIERGVIIRIVVGMNNNNKKNYNDRMKSNKFIASFYLDLLIEFMKAFDTKLNKQIFIYQWEDGDNSYHLKNLLIDNHITLLTSSNYNCRSEYFDYENGLMIKAKSDAFKAQLMEEKERILNKTNKLSSLDDINLNMNGKYEKLIPLLKKVKLYKKVASFL